MWEYKILRQLKTIHKLMKDVSVLEVSITNPQEDKHEVIEAGIGIIDKYGWMKSPNVTNEGHLAYFLAKEFKSLYDYYHNWRFNTIGLNLAFSSTDCLRCIQEQKKYGLSREEDEEIYVNTLNLLRKEYLQKTVLKKDTTDVVNQANTVFKGLRDRILALYDANYPKAVKGLEL